MNRANKKDANREHAILQRAVAFFVLVMGLIVSVAFYACSDGEQTGGVALTPQITEHAAESSGFRNTVLYYLTDSGHIAPIMKRIPWEEGIGKAALSCLVATDENALAAKRMGLNAIIPEGVSFDITIDESSCASLDIRNLPQLENEETEKALLTTVVNTLLEFPTIQSVTVLLDGESVDELPLGTPLKESMGYIAMNPDEDSAATLSADNASPMTIYFPNSSCALQIPVTVYAPENATFETAIKQMLEGSSDNGLKNCFPEGTALLCATLTDGVAAANFTGEFLDIAEDASGVFSALYKSIYLTAKEFGEVGELRLYVEGEYFMPEEALQASAPLYANEWR